MVVEGVQSEALNPDDEASEWRWSRHATEGAGYESKLSSGRSGGVGR